jgi:hypothetical protein
VALFERNRRTVLVTRGGAELIERARRVLREVKELGQTAEQLRDPFTGTLRVGVIPTIAPYLLPEITPALASSASPAGNPVSEKLSGLCPVAGMAKRNGVAGRAPTVNGG